jgi:predicted DNA-binding transcriptional regulator YafY
MRARVRVHKRRGAQLRLALAVLARLEGQHATVTDLSEALGVHRRTIWRVLAEIRAAGLPLLAGREPAGPEFRYRLRAGWLRAPRRGGRGQAHRPRLGGIANA